MCSAFFPKILSYNTGLGLLEKPTIAISACSLAMQFH